MKSLPPNPNAFANSPLDRAAHHRSDNAWLDEARARADAQYVIIHNQNILLAEDGRARQVVWLGPQALAPLGLDARQSLFLGLDAQGAPVFALNAARADAFDGLGEFEDFRMASPLVAADDLAIIGCAKAIFGWHERNGFCANCGAPTDIVEAGWKRACSACGAEHFPRVDPVVIMLPTIDDRCLLAWQSAWPRGMVSALAGFVEPGETIEEAVARETLEEAGLVVNNVQLHSSQPWPFPSSLMIGAICTVESDVLAIDKKELAGAEWFSREDAQNLMRGVYPGKFCPPPFAIAHQILKSWVG